MRIHRIPAVTIAALLFAACGTASAQSNGVASLSPGIINLYAGAANGCAGVVTPAPSSPYDGCPPANIKFGGVRTLAFDSAGNLYLPDASDHRIRKITPAGVVSTFVGTGSTTGITYSSTGAQLGDGGPATAAIVVTPPTLITDSFNNLYFSDYGTNRVRVVYQGPGTDPAATLIALENPGVTPQKGYVYTIAGTGQPGPTGDGGLAISATLSNTANVNSSNSLNGLGVDSSGNVYIADSTNNTIREINAKTGIITTIAGTPSLTGGSTGDGGLATSALLNLPRGIWISSAGDIFLADSSNSKIRMINGPLTTATSTGLGHGFAPGVIHTVAGGGTASVGPYGGLATNAKVANAVRSVSADAAGDIYIGDSGNYRVEKVDVNGIITVAAGNQALTSGFPANTSLSTVTGLGGPSNAVNMGQPYSGTINPLTGDLLVSDYTVNAIYVVSASSSAINFGSQSTYLSSAAQSVTLSNVGAGVLHLSGVSLAGNGFSITTSGRTDCTATTVLQPGQSCQVAVLFTPTALGAASGTLTLTDDSLGTLGTQQTIALTGTGTTTNSITTLSATPALITVGQSATLKATVTSSTGVPVTAPTGTVTFLNGTTSLGNVSLDATGTATLSVPGLGVGTYTSLTASYGGDAVYTASVSAAASLQVTSLGISSTVVTTSQQTVLPGQTATFSVVVSGAGGPPAGNVSVFDGTTTLASGLPLTNGAATFSTTSLSVGYHAISATYAGSASFTASTSATLPLLVSSSANPLATVVPGVISTIAGTQGTKGSTGDGATASAALFASPSHMAVDASGNVYVSDTSNHTVREIVATNGVISATSIVQLVAGVEGTPGLSGDGSAPTAAKLFGPQGLAIDLAGNVYIADTLNNCVRLISAGKISTFAGTKTAGYSGDGGAATSATLNGPTEVAVDRAGNVYIADTGNNVVRLVSGGKISTYAGTGRLTSQGFALGDGGPATAATFSGIAGLAVDLNQNLYISDNGNQVIRKVTASTGRIATFAGLVGTSGYSGDGGPATAAKLLSPGALTVTPAGGLIVSDAGNSAVRQIDASGNIFTIAGNGMSGYSGDGGPSTSAQLTTPGQAVLGNAGDIYVSDTAAATVRFISGSTSAINFPKQASGGAGAPQVLRVVNNGAQSLTLTGAVFSSGVFSQLAQSAADCSSALTLTAGADCTFAVVANSATAGTFSGTLTVTDNSGGTTSQQVTNLSVQTVNVPTQTISFSPLAAVTYGVTPITLSATASSGLAVSYRIVSGPGAITGSTLTVNGAGSIVVEASQAGQPLVWAAASPVQQTLVVNKAKLTVTATSFAQSGGTAIQPLTYSISGFVNNDTQATATSGQPVLTTTATSSSPGGIYPITIAQGTLAAANYTFQFVNGQLTISGTAQTITFNALSAVTYGVSPVTLTATASSGLPVTYSVISGPGTISGATLTVTGAGNIVIQATQPGNADPVTFVGYGPAVPVQQTLVVNKAPLTIAVANATRVYGVANPTFTSTLTGTVNNDVLAASYSTPATPGSAPGTYSVTATLTGVNAASYQVSVNAGTLTVTQATPQFLLSANPAQGNYGSSMTLTAAFVANQGAAPTGSVTFLNGAASLGTAGLNNGIATLTSKTLPPGALSVTVSYAGDTNYTATTSTALGVNVVSLTTTGLSVTPSTSNVGDTVTLSTTVTATAPGAGTPTGTVSFLSGSTTLGTASLSGGAAQLVVTSLPLGANAITAQYGGATLFAASTSATVTSTVTQPFAITVPVSTVTVTAGQTAQIQGTISANNLYAKAIAVTCTGLPQNATCGLSTTNFTPNASVTSLPLNIQISTASTVAANRQTGTRGIGWALLGAGFLVAFGRRRRKFSTIALAMAFTAAAIFGTVGCGSSPGATKTSPAGTSTISITGTSGNTVITTNFTLVVQ